MRARRTAPWLALLLFAAACAQPALAQIPGQNERSRRIGKRMMCMCGCKQGLVDCNHVGCTMSTKMLGELDDRVARGEPDDLIIQSFVQQYGQAVIAQPPSTGFGISAWVMPFAVALAGFLVMMAVLRRWRNSAAPQGGVASAGVPSEYLEQARRETED